MFSNDQAIELCNAVVWQAAQDYRKALVARHKWWLARNQREVAIWNTKVKTIESFFKGDDIKLYTRLDGRELMKRIEREVMDCNYDPKVIKEGHRTKEVGIVNDEY